MYLENHAKRLLNISQSSDEEDDRYIDYKSKTIKYKRDLRLAEELIKNLKIENGQNKQLITELLLDLDESKHRENELLKQLQEQKELTESAVDQLKRTMDYTFEDKLLSEQKQFQDKLTIQSTEAMQKLKQHFDDQLQQYSTPKNLKNTKLLHSKKSPKPKKK